MQLDARGHQLMSGYAANSQEEVAGNLLQRTLEQSAHPESFRELRCLLAPPTGTYVSAEHPLVMEEEQWSAHLMHVSLPIQTEVWFSSLWYYYGLPGKWALVHKVMHTQTWR